MKAIPISVKLLLGISLIAILAWNNIRNVSYGGDFTLNLDGAPWSYAKSSKKLNLLYFGYTRCSDVCPLTLAHVGEVFRNLTTEEHKLVQLIFVNVDSEHQSQNETAKYAKNFFPDFIGLNGSKQQIDKVIQSFPAGYMVENAPKSYAGYNIAHSDKLFFLDQSGKVIDWIVSPKNSDKILMEIRKQLWR